MGRWYAYEKTLMNLEKYLRIDLQTVYDRTAEKKLFRKIIFIENFVGDNDDGYTYIIYSTEEKAMQEYKKIQDLLLDKNIKEELDELRQMILHFPVYGKIYENAEEEFAKAILSNDKKFVSKSEKETKQDNKELKVEIKDKEFKND